MFSLTNEHSETQLFSALLRMYWSISNVTWGTEYITSNSKGLCSILSHVKLIKSIPLSVPHIFRNLYSSATPSAWHIGASLYEMDDDWVKSVQ